MLCDYCHLLPAAFHFSNGKSCCSSHVMRCPTIKKKSKVNRPEDRSSSIIKMKATLASKTDEQKSITRDKFMKSWNNRTETERQESTIKYMTTRLRNAGVDVPEDISQEEIHTKCSALQTGWFERLTPEKQIEFGNKVTKNNLERWSDPEKASNISANMRKSNSKKSPEQKRSAQVKAMKTKLVKFGVDCDDFTEVDIFAHYSEFQSKLIKDTMTPERLAVLLARPILWNNMSPAEKLEQSIFLIKRMTEHWSSMTNDEKVRRIKKTLKTGYSFKSYSFPSGKEVKVMGYESIVIDHLLADGMAEGDIAIGDESPLIIPYYDTEGMKDRLYYPDIVISSQNRIIEVKSEYYFHKDYRKNMDKRKSVIERGYIFEFWIVKKDKTIEII